MQNLKPFSTEHLVVSLDDECLHRIKPRETLFNRLKRFQFAFNYLYSFILLALLLYGFPNICSVIFIHSFFLVNILN